MVTSMVMITCKRKRTSGSSTCRAMALTPYGVHAMFNMVATVVQGDFEWDAAKAEANIVKHGITFEEAATVITDADAVFLEDAAHPDRFAAIVTSAKGYAIS